MDTGTLTTEAAGTHCRPLDPGEPPVIQLRLESDQAVEPHAHPDRTVVFVVQKGVIALTLDDETHRLEADDVVRFDGSRTIAPRAVEDSEALIVLAPT